MRKQVVAGIVVLSAIAVLAVSPLAEAKLIYVNKLAVGANDGTSWANAYTDLRTATVSAVSGDEIWVAKGVYKPTTGTDRTLSFLIEHKNVSMYGGFAGTETSRQQRNWTANLTVLSGDLAGDDTADADGIVQDWEQIVGQDNSYNVVVVWGASASAVIDGFTITAGMEDDTDTRCVPAQCGSGILSAGANTNLANVVMRGNLGVLNPGGAIYFWEGNGSVTDCSFIGNAGCQGGAAHVRNANVTFTRVLFQNNDARDPTGQSGTANVGGGGLYIGGGTSALTDVQFLSNTARNCGGGMQTDPAITLSNVRFENNSCGEYGGGMKDGGLSTLTNLQFINNTAGWRGGGYSGSGLGNPGGYSQVLFQGNSAGDLGGGFYYEYGGSGSATLANSSFINNQAEQGGAIFQFSGELYVDNALIRNNQASNFSSVLSQQYPGRATMTNCTIYGNTSAGWADFYVNSLNIRNSIVWNNSHGFYGGGGYDVSYSILSHPCPGTCDHVTNSDPLFVSASTGNFRLQATSPAIDAGNNQVSSPALSDYDLDGKPRKRDVASVTDTGNGTAPIVDMGAYEATYGSYLVDVVASPATLGTVSGGGSHNQNSSVTVTATPVATAQFINWTENGTVVSTNANYTFTVTADRQLVANFVLSFTATVAPTSGPLGGGTTVQFTSCSPTMGGGTDISAVWVGGVAAQIVSQAANTFTILTPPMTTSGPKDIVVQSALAGQRTLPGGFTYQPPGTIETLESTVTLDMGDPQNSTRFGTATIGSAYSGYTGLGFLTDLSGTGTGVSVPVPGSHTSVTFRCATPSTWRTAYWVNARNESTPLYRSSGGATLLDGSGGYNTWKNWTINVSGTPGQYLHVAHWGYDSMNLDSIRFNLTTPRGPSYGQWYGGYQVTIRGSNMCDNAADLSSVTLCGVPATQIVSATPTQIVVVAGKTSVGGTGDVRVNSMVHGTAVRANAFTYGPVGDFNADGAVDHLDCDAFELCRSGAQMPYSTGCENADFDNDGDVDQSDFGLFQINYTEPAAK